MFPVTPRPGSEWVPECRIRMNVVVVKSLRSVFLNVSTTQFGKTLMVVPEILVEWFVTLRTV